jgi:hypothetical protein
MTASGPGRLSRPGPQMRAMLNPGRAGWPWCERSESRATEPIVIATVIRTDTLQLWTILLGTRFLFRILCLDGIHE